MSWPTVSLALLSAGCSAGLWSSGVALPGEQMLHAYFSQDHETVTIGGSGAAIDVRSVRCGLPGLSSYTADFSLPLGADFTTGEVVDMDGEVTGKYRNATRCDALSSDVPNPADSGDTGA